ncbi:hypothetical protein BB8028_0001g16160 [Beauveria bassiana]|uniref:Uncharacterized protein n=1 Tax=Beauveria bassiana TaxID=176275 RepID=A0A2S7Y073_BEABA|nr:hypothetical protein BB8028_0001g16160 [Beauveria bassiana]
MYHLFGDLYLDDPRPGSPLSRRLQRLRPYIDELKFRKNALWQGWGHLAAFQKIAHHEVAAWQAHGQKRKIRFLIPPDGPLKAPLACHLHNPNFSVSDSYSSHGADESTLSMNQILAAGFTPDKVLIYDYTFHQAPINPLMAYPPNILKIHQRFTAELRMKMAAVVDVVWGAPVRERMKRTLSLEELPLWEEYEGASIHLEWEKSSRNVRHPEAMMYSEPST